MVRYYCKRRAVTRLELPNDASWQSIATVTHIHHELLAAGFRECGRFRFLVGKWIWWLLRPFGRSRCSSVFVPEEPDGSLGPAIFSEDRP